MTTSPFQVPVVQTRYAKVLVEVFSDYGLNVQSVLEEAGLPSDLFSNANDFVPSESVKRLIYLTSSQLGTARFTDLLALAFRQRIIPQVLNQFQRYETVGDALLNVNTIFSNDSPGSRVVLKQEYGQNWFCRYADFEDSGKFVWSETFAIIYIIELMSLLTHSKWQPTQVKVQSKTTEIIEAVVPKSCQLYVEHDCASVLIPDEVLKTPISLSNKVLAPKPQLIEWHTSFTDSVFEVLLPYVKEHSLTIELAADLLNYSVRTLQRKLKEEHTSFRNIRDSLILSSACELMEAGHSLTYISTQLGFANISHFSRAFKRISGLSPKLYRSSIIGNVSLDEDSRS